MASQLVHLLIIILVVAVVLAAIQPLKIDDGFKQAARLVAIGVVVIYAIFILLSMLPVGT